MTRSSTWNRDDPKCQAHLHYSFQEERCEHSVLLSLLLAYIHFQTGPAAQEIEKMAADEKYKGKVNFVLCNMKSLEDAQDPLGPMAGT